MQKMENFQFIMKYIHVWKIKSIQMEKVICMIDVCRIIDGRIRDTHKYEGFTYSMTLQNITTTMESHSFRVLLRGAVL